MREKEKEKERVRVEEEVGREILVRTWGGARGHEMGERDEGVTG